MFPKIADWEVFSKQVSLICDLIIKAASSCCEKTHLVSADEKTGIQAISRVESPMDLKRCKRVESEYKRHGTTTLIGGFDINKACLVHERLGPTRTEEDFLAFCKDTVALYPQEDEVVFLVDQLNIHKSASLVEWIAQQIGDQQDLGKKGQKGILKNMETRKAFLQNEEHRIRFVYTPKHCSWLNPIENWFGKLQRHVIKKGNFDSVDDLNTKIQKYIEYYNQVMIVPLKWEFKGFKKGEMLKDCIMV